MPAVQAYSQLRYEEQLAVPPNVLCYGHDRMLLYTRQQILGRLGCSAKIAVNRAEFRAYLLSEIPSVVVLCQTLNTQECDDAINIAGGNRTGTRLLVMYTRNPPTEPEIPYSLLATNAGPDAFARAVFDLL